MQEPNITYFLAGWLEFFHFLPFPSLDDNIDLSLLFPPFPPECIGLCALGDDKFVFLLVEAGKE
ncbi:hypothetical protein HYC85_009318 [Camellia sinensis]|uniref:Uncharacterized protein n=1 Tax=Camellia sinensis TaxID=4442 RepID=A0A7J7HHC3_CAMSI|nr:hypothetical protein HYC85_009318 [Camellia sinensis]